MTRTLRLANGSTIALPDEGASPTYTGDTPRQRPRGRPRIGRPLNLPLPDAQHARLAAVAAQRGLPVAEVARRALDLGLGAMEEAIDPDEARYGTIAG